MDEVSHFWEGMIGMTENWYPLDPALVDWGYSQTKAAVPSVIKPVDNSVWGTVISSLTTGRPPDKTESVATGGRHSIS